MARYEKRTTRKNGSNSNARAAEERASTSPEPVALAPEPVAQSPVRSLISGKKLPISANVKIHFIGGRVSTVPYALGLVYDRRRIRLGDKSGVIKVEGL